MQAEDRKLLRDLLTRQRVLALSVLVDGAPYVGQLPFAVRPDFRALLIHASGLARHSRGLTEGAPFAALIQAPDRGGGDPFQLARVGFQGRVRPLPRGSEDYGEAREQYLKKLPSGAPMFSLGDFELYALEIENTRLVAGFARAFSVATRILRELAGSGA